jgi:hypothetical protein
VRLHWHDLPPYGEQGCSLGERGSGLQGLCEKGASGCRVCVGKGAICGSYGAVYCPVMLALLCRFHPQPPSVCVCIGFFRGAQPPTPTAHTCSLMR